MKREAIPDCDPELSDEFDYTTDETETSFEFEDFEAMGINPAKSTKARPGSEQKVLMLSARYAAGLPLWHNGDCYDHGPHERDLMGTLTESRAQPTPQPVELDDE